MNSICVTGVSSFTGAWIAKALAKDGFKVYGLCRQEYEKYDGLKKQRLEFIKSDVEVFFNLPAENPEMQGWILEHRPQIWVHHHHHMHHYRGDQYSWDEFESTCVKPLPAIVESLKRGRCKGIIFSGTEFEVGESQEKPNTKYAASKRKVWMDLKNLSELHKLFLSKVVIPNPFGPFENEDRLVPQFLRAFFAQEYFKCKNPQEARSFIPVDSLAATYVKAAHEILRASENIFRPQGWAFTNEAFLNFLATKLSLGPEALQCVNRVEENLSQGLEVSSIWPQIKMYYGHGSSLID